MPDENDGESTMIFLNGSKRSFKCECLCNVFTKLSDPECGTIYRCNSCWLEYEGE